MLFFEEVRCDCRIVTFSLIIITYVGTNFTKKNRIIIQSWLYKNYTEKIQISSHVRKHNLDTIFIFFNKLHKEYISQINQDKNRLGKTHVHFPKKILSYILNSPQFSEKALQIQKHNPPKPSKSKNLHRIETELPLLQNFHEQLDRRLLAANTRVWLNQLLQVLVQLTPAQWWSFLGGWHPWPPVRYPFDSHLLWCPRRMEGSVPSRVIRKFLSMVSEVGRRWGFTCWFWDRFVSFCMGFRMCVPRGCNWLCVLIGLCLVYDLWMGCKLVLSNDVVFDCFVVDLFDILIWDYGIFL